MNSVSVFLGSSASLIRSVRNPIGDHINKLCTKWLNSGVRIQLLIWEDYNSAYRGHSKQDDYIDDLVLPSDLAIFVVDNGIHEYTQKELDATLEQDESAIHCFVIPCKDGFNEEVYTGLSEKYDNVYKANNVVDICEKLDDIIEEYIKQNALETERPVGLLEKWFYTTIPEDVKDYSEQIGTYIRKLDDISMDDWGIHCALHEQKKPELLDETDHYIPIFKKVTSDEDINEFKSGIEKADDPSHRLECVTLFDAGKIYRNNQDVQQIIGGGRDCFPRKLHSMDSLVAELSTWLRSCKKTLVKPTDVSAKSGIVSINGREVGQVAAYDASGKLGTVSKKADFARNKLKMAIRQNVLNDNAISLEASNDQSNAVLLYQANNVINSWADEMPKIEAKSIEEASAIKSLDAKIQNILTHITNAQLASELTDLLLQKESLIRKHVEEKTISHYMLLSTQLLHVALFDTYLKRYKNQQDEDKLYKRIIDDADSAGIKTAIVEMMRMNWANSLFRNEDPECVAYYETALSNLNSIYDGSTTVSQYISIVLMHLCMCQIEIKDVEGANKTVRLFKDHINRLDETVVRYLADRCMFMTCRINMISIHDSSQHSLVSDAIDLYNEAIESLDMSPSDEMFEDVYIYMPNMIARYYIDHLRQFTSEQYTSIIDIIYNFLKSAKENCKKLSEHDYFSGLFYLSELCHQEGFFYSKNTSYYGTGVECYKEALNIKRWIYNTTKDPSSEPPIAQTLVNYGALELNILRLPQEFGFDKSIYKPLEKAQEAIDIYRRHLETTGAYELEYYEALQLRGTIKWYVPDNDDARSRALDDLKECWDWNKEHFPNEYSRTFLDFSGEILLNENVITQEEFRELEENL